jgi:hypothetical protein
MPAMEGLRRLDLVGRRIILYGGGGGLGLSLLLLLATMGRVNLGLPELIILVGFPLLLGGVIRMIAWIAEGFLLPPGQNQSESD